jgi:hypothetical protein
LAVAAAAAAAGLALTGIVAIGGPQVAVADSLVVTPQKTTCHTETKTPNDKICTDPAYAKAKKPSIKLLANGKTSLTHKEGSASTFTMTSAFKGFPTKGKCALRMMVKFGAADWATAQDWEKGDCKDFNFKLVQSKTDLALMCFNAPTTVKLRWDVKIADTKKVVKSKSMSLRFKDACPTATATE